MANEKAKGTANGLTKEQMHELASQVPKHKPFPLKRPAPLLVDCNG